MYTKASIMQHFTFFSLSSDLTHFLLFLTTSDDTQDQINCYGFGKSLFWLTITTTTFADHSLVF